MMMSLVAHVDTSCCCLCLLVWFFVFVLTHFLFVGWLFFWLVLNVLTSGQREAAVNNLSLILQLVIPNLYSEMYTRVSPASASLLCAALQISNAHLAIPLLWPTKQQ
eukprot:m.95121 g.95121  ORF g.95121 m.95121 type:complete len:107 (+) comp26786_c4_seq7:176-496(+)